MIGTRHLNCYVNKYHFLNFLDIHNKDTFKLFKNRQDIKRTGLYAIVKTTKIDFKIDTFYFSSNYILRGDIQIGETREPIEIDLIKYYYDAYGNTFNSIEMFREALEEGLNSIQFPKTGSSISDTYRINAKVLVEHSNAKQIMLACPMYLLLSNQESQNLVFDIYRVLNFFNIDILDNLEICYIGKSENSTLNRLKTHEKWAEILHQRLTNIFEQNKDYLAYLFELKQSDISLHEIDEENIVVINEKANLSKKDLLGICEVALISHFKPQLNKQDVDTNIEESDLVKDTLKGLGYTHLSVQMILDGIFGKIHTEQNPINHEMSVIYEL